MSRRSATVFDAEVARGRLSEELFDVLVVGGGITGAGVLLDAAARGLRAGLVERDDFAAGTSSKSSKLVHGGLRYLQQREFALVRENLIERQRLLRNAPHLVRPLAFVVPMFGSGGVVDKTVRRAYSVALSMYDVAGGFRIGSRHKAISAEEVAARFPTLRRDRLVSGFLYYDAQADDARLTLAVVRTAVLNNGAVALNHAPVTALDRAPGGPGFVVRIDPAGASPFSVRARTVVNATGVWADQVRGLVEKEVPSTLRPAEGIHLAVRREKLPCETAAVLPVPHDRRSIFVIPWGEHTYLGTTDTEYSGPLDFPPVESADVDYLLATVNAAVTTPIRREDVSGAWAGLRPLLAAGPKGKRALSSRTADLSRRHRIDATGDGFVTVTGGKLTTYRKMAEDAVDALEPFLGKLGASPTARLRLRGAGGSETLPPATAGGTDLLAHLGERYGAEAASVLGLTSESPELGSPLVEGLGYVRAEAVYAVRYEMARSLPDVLARRTRALSLEAAATVRAAPAVAALIGPELGWDEETTRRELTELEAFARRESLVAEAWST